MGLRVQCNKGCGHSIDVTDEVLEEVKTSGSPLDVAHDICPTDEGAPMRRYKIVTSIERLVEGSNETWEVLSRMGSEREAGSYKLVIPKLQEDLNEQWSRIVGMADIAEDD